MPACDPLLVPLLEAPEEDREPLSARLLAEHADPIIRWRRLMGFRRGTSVRAGRTDQIAATIR
jgi:hypothetical protein